MIRTEKVTGYLSKEIEGFKVTTKLRKRAYKAKGQTCKGKGKGAQAVRIEAKIEAVYSSLSVEAKRYDKEKKRLNQLNKRVAKRQARKAGK